MADTFTFTIKPITDLSDVKANVGEIQKAFKNLKLPDKISGNLDKNIANILKEFDKYETKVKEGIKTSGDYRQVESSLSKINNLYQDIVKDVQNVAKSDLSDIFDVNSGDFKEVGDQIKEITKQLENIKIDPDKLSAPINQLKQAIKNEKISGKEGLLNQLIGHVDNGELEDAKAALRELEKYINKVSVKKDAQGNILGSTVGKLSSANTDAAKSALTEIQQVFTEAQAKGVPLEETLATLQQRFKEVQTTSENSLKEFSKKAQESEGEVESLTTTLQKAHKEDFNFDNQVKSIDRQIQSYFGLGQMIRKVGQIARDAFKTIQELDKAMTETAVVTNYSVGDMWEKLPLYTAEANKLGSSIKDVYEATTLYYQQGLNTTQSMGLAVETLKMARIAGMDAKDATDAMTAALRGFNLELNQVSAQRINDVYSELAAITASDTQEISTAMEKVASLAHNAGMELETTAAFLAQMIETTREAPENLGTALKTVVARFQEMKQDPTKLIDSEGVMLDANKVDKALKSIGVNLMNANGEFRKLDDVFLEIASKWDTLSMGQQRYIATMAAGSRQQSRFIAMMSNYSRTMELVDAAYDSSGASQRQFEKTLEGLDAKLNQLKNAWAKFAMGLMNNELLKGGIDLLTKFIDGVNRFIDIVGEIPPDPFKGVTKSLTTLILTLGGLGVARTALSKGIESGVGWFKREMTGKEAITNLFFSPQNAIKEARMEREAARKAGTEAGNAFGIAYNNAKNRILNKPQNILTNQLINPSSNDLIAQRLQQQIKQQMPDVNELYLKGVANSVKAGNGEQIAKSFGLDWSSISKGIDGLDTRMGKLATHTTSVGVAFQAFGDILQGTPFAPVGKAISLLGSGLVAFGSSLITVDAAGQVTVMTFGEMAAAAGALLVELLPIIAVIGAVAAVGYLLYREFTKDKREMEALAEAAKTSSDAFDNLKTATDELKNSIEEIRNADSLFDGLVVGTTEWNLALVEANQQILDLIKKYSMLQDYMTTDANGRMHISEAGFKAVQEEQNRLLGQAQALDIYNNALHNAALERQEQDDLLKEEGVQKTKAGTRRVRGKRQTTSQSQADTINRNALSEEGQREWDSIEARIKAESDAASKQAIRAALSSSGELNDTVLSLFSQNFDEAQKAFSTSGVDINAMKQAYADFIGGVFNSATGTITDLSGEEVPVDNDTLKKMYPQIMALLQFQEQAPKVESAVKSLGKSFDSVFGSAKGSNFINDLLNNNLEIDLSQLEEFRNMEVDEIVDILGDSGDELAKVILQNENASAEDLANQLKENAENLKQIQTKAYADAAVWYAKSKGVKATQIEKIPKQYANLITKGLTAGSAEAANRFMDQVSRSFDSTNAMSMGQNLFDALLGAPDEATQQKLAELINSVDWTSAIERGQFYETYAEGTEAFEELNNKQKEFITGQKRVDKSLNLTGKQFEELVQSSDFLEILTDKWKDFADESGNIDASGIEEMAKECGTLQKILELDGFEAENLATALNYFQETGSFDGINSATLAAMKHFNALDNLVTQVKKDLDNFDEGQDYSEGIEAYRERMGTIKENYEKGYYSNETALNAIKNLFSEEFYYTKVKEFGSNKELEKYLINNAAPLLTDSLQDTALMAINNMARGLDILGEQMTINDERLKVFYGDSGLEFDIGNMTYEEVVAEMATRLHVSEELARGILEGLIGQDWGIVGDNLAEDLMKNGREAGISEFARIQTTETTGFDIDEGQAVAISQSTFDALKTTGGYIEQYGEEAAAQLQTDLTNAFGKTVQVFDDTTDNLDSYLAAKYGANTENEGSLRSAGLDLFDAKNNVGNFTKVIQQLQADGYNYQKAVELAYKQAKELDLKSLLIDGKEMDISDVLNATEFNDAIEEFKEASKWEEVGNIIADAIVTAFEDAGIIGNTPKEGANPEKITGAADLVTVKANIEVQKNTLEQELKNANQEVVDLQKEITKLSQIDPNNPELPMLQEQLAEAQKKASNVTAELQGVNDQLNSINNKNVNIKFISTINGVASSISNIAANVAHVVAHSSAKGSNNYISPSGFYAGSSARGRYGTVGPKNKGGLTLTGEKGFEIAWLPSENRSMILGAHGPQMLNLPSDAVVYSHEQSKDIIKQKSIPAGSHAGHYDYSSGSSGGSRGSSSGSSSGSKSSSSDKGKDPKHSNWYKEEVRRFNLNQSINQLTEKIEKITKSISDTLAKLGVKYSDISKDVEKQTQLLHQTIAQQQQLRDSYKAELEWLANGNRQLWVSLTNASNESEEISVGTSQFISGNADTGYSVSYDAIIKYLQANGYGGENLTANAESLFNLLNQQISNLQSSFNSAAKAIEDAQQKLKDLVNQVREAFYGWENELTRVYDLSKQLELNEAMNGRFTSEIGLLLSSVSTQFEDMATVLDHLNDAQQGSIELTKQRLELLYAMIQARQEEIEALMDGGSAEKERYEAIKAENEAALKNGQALTAEMLAREAAAYDEYARAAWGQLYVTSTQNADGSYTFDFNEEQLEADRLAGKISEDTYNVIKDGFDNLVEGQIDYHEAISEVQDYLKELGEQLDDYYKTMADLENNLIDAFVDAAQKEVSKLEALNSSLTNAAKSVLEQVKKSIDARRKAEDNAKTEADIARKQERLSILRANTGGGNQVEIAQLEKEISDAQRSYGRTLEDQMFAQMQTQADEASKQRQQQIDLAKQQIEYNKQAGVYAAMADELLDDIKANATQIALLLDETKELGRGKWEQLIDKNEIERQIIEAGNASAAIPYLEEAISQQQDLYNALIQLDQDMMEVVGSTIGQGQNNPDTPGVYNPTNGGIPTTGSTGSGSSGGSSSGSGTANSTPKATDYASGWLATLPETNSNYFSSAQVRTLQHGLNTMKWSGLINFGADLAIDGIIGPKTTAAIKALQKLVGTTQDGIWGPNTGKATHKKFPKYARGGLNKTTGPAWLDGTRAKPELVLNAQDTKNFIALKDILSGVMRTISHTDTSNIYNSPTEFNINVNVEKIASDYDVDRLAARIKRDIVKDATYRNVTAVRNFR